MYLEKIDNASIDNILALTLMNHIKRKVNNSYIQVRQLYF